MGIKNDKVLNKTGTEYLVSKIKALITQSINGLAAVARTGSYNDLSDKPEHLGHSIKDVTTTLTDRAGLKFTGNVEVSDDSTNDETVVNIKGKPDHVYSTKAQMLADVSNIGEGEMAYTTEDAGDVLTRIEDLEEDVSQISSDLSDTKTTIYKGCSGYSPWIIEKSLTSNDSEDASLIATEDNTIFRALVGNGGNSSVSLVQLNIYIADDLVYQQRLTDTNYGSIVACTPPVKKGVLVRFFARANFSSGNADFKVGKLT